MKRIPPSYDSYPDAGILLRRPVDRLYSDYAIEPLSSPWKYGITAKQAREAAHLLNQLAEYLDSQRLTSDAN